jgi:hypothetical protein
VLANAKKSLPEGGFFGAKGALLDVSLQAEMTEGKVDPTFILFLDSMA